MNSFSQFQAVGLAITGYTLWVFADASLKAAGASGLPAYEVIGLVGLVEVLILFAYALVTRNPAGLWPRQPGRQLLRSFLDLANNLCVVIAVRHLPLALFYILVFLAPMVTTLLAAVFLREGLEWKQGLAIFTGFVGVIVAVNPFGMAHPGSWVGYLACMVCVAAFSANMVWSRVLTQTETPQSLTFFSGLVMTIVGAAGCLFYARPVTPHFEFILAGTSLFCVLGSTCFFLALKNASAATVSQYHYSQLLTGSLVAYVFWHEKLTVAMLLGSVLIIVSGVYTAARSYGHDRRSATLNLAPEPAPSLAFRELAEK